MIKVTESGSFSKTMSFLGRAKRRSEFSSLEKYGPMGVAALAAATPKESGETAASWYYEVVQRPGYYAIHWSNSHVVGDITPVAVLIQYGHGTKNGGFVQGVDYINPAMRPIFEQMANEMWKEVTK